MYTAEQYHEMTGTEARIAAWLREYGFESFKLDPDSEESALWIECASSTGTVTRIVVGFNCSHIPSEAAFGAGEARGEVWDEDFNPVDVYVAKGPRSLVAWIKAEARKARR